MTRTRRANGWLRAALALHAPVWKKRRGGGRGCPLGVLFGLLAFQCAWSSPASDRHPFKIPAGLARESLQELSAQTGIRIEISIPSSVDPHTRALSGTYTTAAALGELLAGTDLTFAFVGPDTVEVRQALGKLLWYDIKAGPALESLRAFVDTSRVDASFDLEAVKAARMSEVHGCLSAEDAALKLLKGTPFTHDWLTNAPDEPPATRALVLHTPSSRAPTRATPKVWVAEARRNQCWRLCTAEDTSPPPLTCVHYAPQFP